MDLIGLDEELKRSGDSVSGKENEMSGHKLVYPQCRMKFTSMFCEATLVQNYSWIILLNEHLRAQISSKAFQSPEFLLTSVVGRAMDDCVILFLVPSRILFLPWEWRTYFCHLTGVPAALAGVHGTPVQTGTSGDGRKDFSQEILNDNLTESKIDTQGVKDFLVRLA